MPTRTRGFILQLEKGYYKRLDCDSYYPSTLSRVYTSKYIYQTFCMECLEWEGRVVKAACRAFPLRYKQERVDKFARRTLDRCLWVRKQERERVQNTLRQVCGKARTGGARRGGQRFVPCLPDAEDLISMSKAVDVQVHFCRYERDLPRFTRTSITRMK